LSECAFPECLNAPRASRGKRPAKYCEEHSTSAARVAVHRGTVAPLPECCRDARAANPRVRKCAQHRTRNTPTPRPSRSKDALEGYWDEDLRVQGLGVARGFHPSSDPFLIDATMAIALLPEERSGDVRAYRHLDHVKASWKGHGGLYGVGGRSAPEAYPFQGPDLKRSLRTSPLGVGNTSHFPSSRLHA